MNQTKTKRIESIDILRGIVMVLMALDHTRDYFHIDNAINSPTDLDTTTPFLFFTRFITHYCAPVFVFLAGTSAFLYGTKKTNKDLSRFLFIRGVWLVVLEVLINNLIWQFDITYSFVVLQVLWAIGISMMALSVLIYLPKKLLLALGLIIVVGHNALDNVQMSGNNTSAILWYIIHQRNGVLIGDDVLVFAYPVLPWIGVMTLGYLFGTLYTSNFNLQSRKKYLVLLGIGSLVSFFVLRGLNLYGDLVPWSYQPEFSYTMLSFFNVTKYPPSIDYLLITLGPAFLFLAGIESVKNRITDFFLVFGRVPFFYYFLHVLLIHTLAILGVLLFNNDWSALAKPRGLSPIAIAAFGYPLWVTYIMWVIVVLMLYPFCKRYMEYKACNRDKWWLSYL